MSDTTVDESEGLDPESEPPLVDGEEPPEETERQMLRREEDDRFVPVVVKRNDQATRHPEDTLRLAIREGAEQAGRPQLSLLLSAIAAGAILGFSAMAVGVTATLFEGDLVVPERILLAFAYPLGFILCLTSGTELFTEHTALAVYPVLDRRARVTGMLRLWSTVLAGNVIGCAAGAGLLALADGSIGAAEGYAQVAHHLLDFGSVEVGASALLAGWLMAQGGWLMLASPFGVGQILLIYVTTFLIGLGGLHHSIVGTSEVLVAGFTGAPISISGALGTLAIAVIGNLIGGALFVAALNYGHLRKTKQGA